LQHGDRGGRLVVEQAAQRIDAGAHLDAGDVAQPRHLPFRRGTDDDVAELLFRRQPALGVNQQLEGAVARCRRRTKHAGGNLDVLLANHAHDVGRRQPPRRQPIGIQPDAHAVLAAAEHLHVTDAINAAQLVAHLQECVVGQIQHVVAFVGRYQVDDHQEVRVRLLGGDADALHFDRQPRLRLGDTILHLDLRDVRIGAERKREGQRQRAIGRRLREHVQHALDAVELLLQRRRHRFGGDLRIGARIDGPDHDRRRDDFGILADRQPDE
jgi:hypothetical protein